MAALGRAAEIPLRACRRVLHGLGQSHHTDVIARHLSAPGPRRGVQAGHFCARCCTTSLSSRRARGRVALAVLSSPPAAAEGLARLAARIHAAVTAP